MVHKTRVALVACVGIDMGTLSTQPLQRHLLAVATHVVPHRLLAVHATISPISARHHIRLNRRVIVQRHVHAMHVERHHVQQAMRLWRDSLVYLARTEINATEEVIMMLGLIITLSFVAICVGGSSCIAYVLYIVSSPGRGRAWGLPKPQHTRVVDDQHVRVVDPEKVTSDQFMNEANAEVERFLSPLPWERYVSGISKV